MELGAFDLLTSTDFPPGEGVTSADIVSASAEPAPVLVLAFK
jgi:hypothetical protein